ncbi:hypothetical protein chiPu_0020455 [Chiloscyllium punctatum]|uniref:Uncharacterized protein n=1 Tax=Chiloscyllium punctatum TaxID=137246 RepID=A0A401RFQ4_CHIPU|nr:hypothetical protein [Chiloscyllium punctatum]
MWIAGFGSPVQSAHFCSGLPLVLEVVGVVCVPAPCTHTSHVAGPPLTGLLAIRRMVERRLSGPCHQKATAPSVPYPVTVSVPISTRPARGTGSGAASPPATLRALLFRGWRSTCVVCLHDRSPLVSRHFSLPLSDRRAVSVGWCSHVLAGKS